MFVQAQTDFGGLHPARGAAHQLHAHSLFQLREVVADIGAAHLQLGGGAAQVACVDDFHKQCQGGVIHTTKTSDCSNFFDSLSMIYVIVK
ncbi:hypothetical protein D3C72_2197330 [compost metagenome]